MYKKIIGASAVLAITGFAVFFNSNASFDSIINLSSVENGELADFRVTNLRYFDANNPDAQINNPMRGDRVIPQFTIENTGEETAAEFYVLVEDMTRASGLNEDGSISYSGYNIIVENLEPSESRDIRASTPYILQAQGENHRWRVTADAYMSVDEHNEYDNTFNFNTALVANRHATPSFDYLSNEPRMTPSNNIRGDAHEVALNGRFTLNTEIRNMDYIRGLHEVEDTVVAHLVIDDVVVARPVVALTHGRGSFDYVVNGNVLGLGEVAVEVRVDPENAKAEYNERNNTTFGRTIRVLENVVAQNPMPRSDLTITNVSYELYNQRGVSVPRASLQRGDLFYPIIRVRNNGTAPTEDIFYVQVEDHSRVGGIDNDGRVVPFATNVMFQPLGVGEEGTATTVSPIVVNGRTGSGDSMRLKLILDPGNYYQELNEENNLQTETITFARAPLQQSSVDFIPMGMRWLPDNVVIHDNTGGHYEINQNGNINFAIRIDNGDYVNFPGRNNSHTVPVQVRVGNVTKTVNVEVTEAINEFEVNFTGRELGLGDHQTEVIIDSDNAIAEANENNNSRSHHILRVVERGAHQHVQIARPELGLESVAFKRLDNGVWRDIEPNELQRGDWYYPYITVRNSGTADSRDFYVILEDHSGWMRDPVTGQMGPFQTALYFENITPGESRTATAISPLIVNGTGGERTRLGIKVDGFRNVTEFNEDNNFTSYTIVKEQIPLVLSYDFVCSFVGRTPVNEVQAGSWRINTNEILPLEMKIKNIDFVEAAHLDHTVNNLPVEVRIGPNYRRTVMANLTDRVNFVEIPFEVSGADLGVGVFPVEVRVDPLNQFVEYNERNNIASDVYSTITVSQPPVAPNLKVASARFVNIAGNDYYPVVSILNDSDLSVDRSFEVNIHNKGAYVGLDEWDNPRYRKVVMTIQRMAPHETIELVGDGLTVSATEPLRASSIWVEVDASSFRLSGQVVENNETDNSSFYNIGALVDALIPAPAAAEPVEVPAPVTPPAEAPAPSIAKKLEVKPLIELPKSDFVITTKPVAGLKVIKGTCAVSLIDNPKFTALVNNQVASPVASCVGGKFELKLKAALKAKDKLIIETTRGKTKTKSSEVVIK